MNDLPKWKLEGCNCWVDAFRYIKICDKHQKEFDEVSKRWDDDYKRLSKEFDELCDKPREEYVAPIQTEQVIKGDLTSLM